MIARPQRRQLFIPIDQALADPKLLGVLKLLSREPASLVDCRCAIGQSRNNR